MEDELFKVTEAVSRGATFGGVQGQGSAPVKGETLGPSRSTDLAQSVLPCDTQYWVLPDANDLAREVRAARAWEVPQEKQG